MADCGFSGFNQGFLQRFGFSHEADDQAVVVGVRTEVEKCAPCLVPESLYDRLDDLGPPSFAKIRDAFQEFLAHPASTSLWEMPLRALSTDFFTKAASRG